MLFSIDRGGAVIRAGVAALVMIDKLIFRKIDFMEEFKKGNIVVAIFQSVILLLIDIVVSAAVT